MKKLGLLPLSLFVIFFTSCVSARKNPYPGMNVLKYDEHSMYEFKNLKKDGTVIYIDGSGLGSVLGEKENGTWKNVHFGYYILNAFRGDFTIAFPERLNMRPGMDYSRDRNILNSYTVDSLVACYSDVIDKYLENEKISSCSVVALSEGGLLLPKIYSVLKHRDKIKKMVVWGSGGLSQYECFKILGKSEISMPDQYRNECLKIDYYKRKIDENPDSVNDYYLGWPYKRWASFFKYRPYEYYTKINIPVLFIQGVRDWSSPYESVKYLENNLKGNNFEYRYFTDMGHVPESDEKIMELLSETKLWLNGN